MAVVAAGSHYDNGLGYGAYSLHNGGYAKGNTWKFKEWYEFCHFLSFFDAKGIGSYGGFGDHGYAGYRGAVHHGYWRQNNFVMKLSNLG